MLHHRFLPCVLAATALALTGADWRQFRGSHSDSVSPNDQIPLEWNDNQNIAWRIDLPGRGPSSPIVVGDRVFVTCSSGRNQTRLHVLSFSAETGQKIWERQFWATGRTMMHPSTANAAPTPASDGKQVFAFYSSNDLVCLDLDGNLRWFRGLAYDYPKLATTWGWPRRRSWPTKQSSCRSRTKEIRSRPDWTVKQANPAGV